VADAKGRKSEQQCEEKGGASKKEAQEGAEQERGRENSWVAMGGGPGEGGGQNLPGWLVSVAPVQGKTSGGWLREEWAHPLYYVIPAY